LVYIQIARLLHGAYKVKLTTSKVTASELTVDSATCL
jgi:hypothetical protein